MVNDLVSILIPCYNAATWIRETIDSCLAQLYQPIEIIAVDDGSTDESLSILKSYDSLIRMATGPNYGGNHARNWAFSMAQGTFIQFLDADDCLLPEKIERQVAFLEETGADVVYGDWRHQHHRANGTSFLGPVETPGAQNNILASLLAGWWVAPAALLFRRQAVISSGGWDEALQAGQDRDFFTAVAIAGADIRYQPGCYSIYRRYGPVTVSTGNQQRWLENHTRIVEKAETKLADAGRLCLKYREALAKSYFFLARNYYDIDRAQYSRLLQKALSLDPGFAPGQSPLYDFLARTCGFRVAETLASAKRRARSILR